MKKLFITIFTSIKYTFSFFPLQGPYYLTNSREVIKQLKEETLEDPYHPPYYFLYNPFTSIIMMVNMPKLPSKLKYIQSICDENVQTFLNEVHKTTLFYRNERLKFLKGIFLFDNIPLHKSSITLDDFMFNFISTLDFKFQFQKGLFISKKDKLFLKNISMNSTLNLLSMNDIISLSNVKIENKNEQAILSKEDKQTELTTALKKHFTIPLQVHIDLIHALPKLNQGSSKELLPKLYNYTFYSAIQDRLNESKILAIWDLILTEILDSNGNKKTIQSQIIGIAEDKDGKLFHWITDLKKDISELMQYAE